MRSLSHTNKASWDFGGHEPPTNLDTLVVRYAIIDGVKIDPQSPTWRDVADAAMKAAVRRYGFPILMSKAKYMHAIEEVVLRPTAGKIDIRVTGYSEAADTEYLAMLIHAYCHEAGADYHVSFAWEGHDGTYSSKGDLALLPPLDA